MKNILNFLVRVGELKRKHRKGWQVHQIKDSETTAEHIFRMTIIAWILGKEKRLNIEKVIKIALVHDLCEVYAGDITPYDSVLPTDKKKLKELMKTWPRFSNYERKRNSLKKYKREKKALDKLQKAFNNNI